MSLVEAVARVCECDVIQNEQLQVLECMHRESGENFACALRDVLLSPAVSERAKVFGLIIFDKFGCRFSLDDGAFVSFLGNFLAGPQEAWQNRAGRIFLNNIESYEVLRHVIDGLGPESYPAQLLALEFTRRDLCFRPDLFEMFVIAMRNESLEWRVRFSACKGCVKMCNFLPSGARDECIQMLVGVIDSFSESVDNFVLIGRLHTLSMRMLDMKDDRKLMQCVSMVIALYRYLRSGELDTARRRAISDAIGNFLNTVSIPLVTRVRQGEHGLDMHVILEFVLENFYQCEPEDAAKQAWQTPEGWYSQIETDLGAEDSECEDEDEDTPSLSERAYYILVQLGQLILPQVIQQDSYDYKSCVLIGMFIQSIAKDDNFKRKVEAVSDPLSLCEIWRSIFLDPTSKGWLISPGKIEALLTGDGSIPSHVTDLVAWMLLSESTRYDYDPRFFVAAFGKALRYLGPEGEFSTGAINEYAQRFATFTEQCLKVERIRNAFREWGGLQEAWAMLFQALAYHRLYKFAIEDITRTFRIFMKFEEFAPAMLPCVMEGFMQMASAASNVSEWICCSEMVSKLFFIPYVFDSIPPNILDILGHILLIVSKENMVPDLSILDVFTVVLLKGKRAEVIELLKRVIMAGQIPRITTLGSMGTLLFSIIREFDSDSGDFLRFIASMERDGSRWTCLRHQIISLLYLSYPEKTVAIAEAVFVRPFQRIIQEIANANMYHESIQLKIQLAVVRKALDAVPDLLSRFYFLVNEFIKKSVTLLSVFVDDSSCLFSDLGVVTRDCNFVLAPPGEFIVTLVGGMEVPEETRVLIHAFCEFSELPEEHPRRLEISESIQKQIHF